MKVEIWSDVICPWCGLGQHRLDAALSNFEHRNDVEVVHRSFQLDPSFPAHTTISVREMLKSKYGMSDQQLQANSRRLEALAAADGLQPYQVGNNRVGNTGLAHIFLAFAAERGLEDAAWKRLYHAYFGEGRSIFDQEALVNLGVELGLVATEIREALNQGHYKAKVLADIQEARRLGVNGVPFVLIDGRLAVSGAQTTDTFRAALNQAWRENPTPLASGEVCSPSGCD